MSLQLYVQVSLNRDPEGFRAMQGDVVRQCYGTSLISPHDMVAILSKLAETGFGNGPADTLGSTFDVCGLPDAVLLFLAIVKNPIMQKLYLDIYKEGTWHAKISAYGYELSLCPLAQEVDKYYVAHSHGFVSGYDGFRSRLLQNYPDCRGHAPAAFSALLHDLQTHITLCSEGTKSTCLSLVEFVKHREAVATALEKTPAFGRTTARGIARAMAPSTPVGEKEVSWQQLVSIDPDSKTWLTTLKDAFPNETPWQLCARVSPTHVISPFALAYITCEVAKLKLGLTQYTDEFLLNAKEKGVAFFSKYRLSPPLSMIKELQRTM